jgi:hypothetical protein
MAHALFQTWKVPSHSKGQSLLILLPLSFLSRGENRRAHHFYPEKESGVRLLFSGCESGGKVCTALSYADGKVCAPLLYIYCTLLPREKKEIEFASLGG